MTSPGCTDTTRNPSLSWQCKSDESTKHYSLNCCLPSTDAIDRWEKFTYAYEGTRSPHASTLHWNPLGFCKKKKIKVKHFSNRLVHIWKCTCKRNYILTIKWSIQRVSCKREEKNWWKIKNDIDVIILMWYEEAKTV